MTKDRPDAPAQDESIEEPGALSRAAGSVVDRIVSLGIAGAGPLDSAAEVAAQARSRYPDDPDRAVQSVVSTHLKLASAGGFATGFGGIITMPVSLPANVVGFYAVAARMVAAIAALRGYDPAEAGTRAAITLALVGAEADDLLAKAGLSAVSGMTGSGRLAKLATDRLPRTAAVMINKAVGFRLLTQFGGKVLARWVRFVPVAGGLVGAGLDGVLMKRIGDHARREFTAA